MNHPPCAHCRLTPIAVAVALATFVVAMIVPSMANAATRPLGAGTATFHLDSGETASLMGEGLEPYPISPALLSLEGSTATLRLPVRGGTWDTSHARGTFLLKGGLTYVLPEEVVTVSTITGLFRKFTMTGWRAGVGTSAGFSIVADGTRTPTFFDQVAKGTASVVTPHGQRYLRVTKLQLSFNATSAGAIKNALGPAPNAGDPFGSVTLLARLK